MIPEEFDYDGIGGGIGTVSPVARGQRVSVGYLARNSRWTWTAVQVDEPRGVGMSRPVNSRAMPPALVMPVFLISLITGNKSAARSCALRRRAAALAARSASVGT